MKRILASIFISIAVTSVASTAAAGESNTLVRVNLPDGRIIAGHVVDETVLSQRDEH